MTPMTTLKALPGLGLGIAVINFTPHWRSNTSEMFIQFFGWVIILLCGGIITGSLLWQLFPWQASKRERAKAMRAMRSEIGQRPNPFHSMWFTNGIILIGIGLAFLGWVEIVLRHRYEWMIFLIFENLSKIINWPILKTIFFSGLVLAVLGVVCVTIPFLIRLKQQLEGLASRNDRLSEAVVQFLTWRNNLWIVFFIALATEVGR